MFDEMVILAMIEPLIMLSEHAPLLPFTKQNLLLGLRREIAESNVMVIYPFNNV